MDDSDNMSLPDITLPPPTGKAAARGAELFARILAAEKAAKRAEQGSAHTQHAIGEDVTRALGTGGRRYPLAWSKAASSDHDVPEFGRLGDSQQGIRPSAYDAEETNPGFDPGTYVQDPGAEARTTPVDMGFAAEELAKSDLDTGAHSDVLDSVTQAETELSTRPIERPPHGSAAVRPSVQERPPEQLPQGLEKVADNLLLSHEPDGTTAFEITFNDEVFTNLRCRLSVHSGRVQATFFVQTSNDRRLLEAESARLRNQLEAKGLTVDGVQVVVESADQSDLSRDP